MCYSLTKEKTYSGSEVMKTIYEYKKAIMSFMEENKACGFKSLHDSVKVTNYEERGNFLEALSLLEIEGKIYNPKKSLYKLFPTDTHKIDQIIKTDDGYQLKNAKIKVQKEMSKEQILDKDIVIITKDSASDNIVIKKIIKRDITSFKDYLVKTLTKKSLNYKQIKRLAVAKSKEDILEIINLLKKLEKEGKIYKANNTYQSFPKNLVLTKIELDNKGRAYYTVDGRIIYPEGDELKGALPQDIIAVTKKGKHIEKIVTRQMSHLVLEVVEVDGIKQLEPVLLPSNEKIKVRISSIDMKKLAVGDRILADVSLAKSDDYYEADFLDKIGRIDDADIDIISIALKYGFNLKFSDNAITEAENLNQEVLADEMINRYDFTKRFLTFTIDCDNTKDMDDAVSILKTSDNHYILGVHIADVAHYVKRGSNLDLEAYERGLSAYPANKVIPMLPHLLSNGICSLNPNTKRLTKSIIMELNENGELLEYKLVNSVIESKKKMSYSAVNKILETGNIDEDYLPFYDSLKLMDELSTKITKIREQEGMLNFKDDETSVIEDSHGNVINLEEKDNGLAGKIIENFMIMANYCADLYLNFTIGSTIHRVHPSPDIRKLSEAEEKLTNLGFDLPKKETMDNATYLQVILDKYKNTPAYQIVSDTLLQALPRARYSPYPLGHYGLGLNYYSHFTSPIRRYPDLKVQQIIDSYLTNNLKDIETEDQLESICDHASFKERQADLLEKEVLKVKMMDYVDRHKDKLYYATVTNIDKNRAYLKTLTNIPGYFEYQPSDDIHYIKSRNYIKNSDDQVILKVGDFIQVEGIEANRRELKAHFAFLKNITLEQQNKKGAHLLSENNQKKLTKK